MNTEYGLGILLCESSAFRQVFRAMKRNHPMIFINMTLKHILKQS